MTRLNEDVHFFATLPLTSNMLIRDIYSFVAGATDGLTQGLTSYLTRAEEGVESSAAIQSSLNNVLIADESLRLPGTVLDITCDTTLLDLRTSEHTYNQAYKNTRVGRVVREIRALYRRGQVGVDERLPCTDPSWFMHPCVSEAIKSY